jgi:hypothetical protein
MNCLEFRRAAGADPEHLGPDAIAHRDACPQCARYLQQVQRMDATILDALRIPATTPAAKAPAAAPRASAAVRASLGDRNRWYALAASIAGGVAIGALLWASGTRDALARDAVAHLAHEPTAMVATQVPADAAQVREVLANDGVRLRSDVGLVTYVMSCSFRGHDVPHLVVQTSQGPVTVLVLRNERVPRAMKFHEQGYAGTIEPSGPGSIAVIGGTDRQVQEAAARIDSALEWTK